MRSGARILATLAFFSVVIAVGVLAAIGIVPAPVALDVLALSVASLSVLALVKLPWDLWFAARMLVAEQAESLRRGVAIDERARNEALAIARRSLAAAIALHVLAAGATLAVSAWLGEGRGYVLSLAYLASMTLRPLQAGWVHVRARIAALRSHALVPREDARALMEEVRERRARDEERAARLQQLEERLEAETLATREREARLEARLDRVLVELERSAERLTEDRELVAGLRALAKMLRSPAAA